MIKTRWISLVFLSAFILITFASALPTNVTNTSENLTIIQPTVYPYTHIGRISQGEDVFVNETVDISGMGWGYGIAWYGSSGVSETPLYIRPFKNNKQDYFNFYLDPAIFSTRPGMWYQYYENSEDRHGNLNVFNVVNGVRNKTMTFPNGTVIDISESNRTTLKDNLKVVESILPERHITDYLVSKGNDLIINETEPFKLWVFGNEGYLYDIDSPSQNLTINATVIETLPVGSYTLFIQKTGNNTIYESNYESGQSSIEVNKVGDFVTVYVDERLVSPWAKVKPIPIRGKTPNQVMLALRSMLDKTDDKYAMYKLEIENPTISIVSMDEIGLGLRESEFRYEEGLVTLFDVRGYTNLANNSKITVIFDKNKWNVRELKSHTYYTYTERSSVGNMSMFKVSVPMIWNKISTGIHTMSAETEFGNVVYSDIPVSIMPADSFRENATLKYTESSNPWKPNLTIPTPVVIVKTQIVKDIVTVTVTPSNEQVQEQQRIATEAVVTKWGSIALVITLFVIVSYFVIRYLVSVYRRI